MTEAQIKHMVDRFLGWKLPENFNPDGGISFKAAYNEHTAWPMKHEPTGTNLFDAVQADGMVRHMLDGLLESLSADQAWRVLSELGQLSRRIRTLLDGYFPAKLLSGEVPCGASPAPLPRSCSGLVSYGNGANRPWIGSGGH